MTKFDEQRPLLLLLFLLRTKRLFIDLKYSKTKKLNSHNNIHFCALLVQFKLERLHRVWMPFLLFLDINCEFVVSSLASIWKFH